MKNSETFCLIQLTKRKMNALVSTITSCSLTQKTFWTTKAGATFCLVALTLACDKVTRDVVPPSDPTGAFVNAVRIVTTNNIMPTKIHFNGFPGDLGPRIDAAIKAEEWSEWPHVEYWSEEIRLHAAKNFLLKLPTTLF